MPSIATAGSSMSASTSDLSAVPGSRPQSKRGCRRQPQSVLAQFIPADLPLPDDIDLRSNFAVISSSLHQELYQDDENVSLRSHSRQRALAVSFTNRGRKGRAPKNIIFAVQVCDDTQMEGLAPLLLSSPLDTILASSPQVIVDVAAIEPPILSSIILATSSHELLQAPTRARELSGLLARQGDVARFPSGLARVIQTEPILQGYVGVQTSVVMVYDPETTRGVAESGPEVEVQDPQGAGFAIDERFLASSILDDFSNGNMEDLEADFETLDLAPGGDGEIEEGSTALSSLRGQKPFAMAVSQDAGDVIVAVQEWRRRLHGQEADTDIDCESAVLLDEAGFAAIGAFEGGWALIQLNTDSPPRLVRLFANQSAAGEGPPSLTALLPPTLWQNIHDRGSFDPLTSDPCHIYLRAIRPSSAYAARHPLQCPLPIPFTDRLVLARVASGLSLNKQYQTVFLAALREHFEDKKRILQQGDIVSVAISKGKVRWIKDSSATAGEGDTANGEQHQKSAADQEPVDYDFPSDESGATQEGPSGVVHFLVTTLTPELSSPSASAASSGDLDYEIIELARTGAFGAVIDSRLTEMVQTGVEHSRFVDCRGWLGVPKDEPREAVETPLTSAKSPYGRILQLLKATLMPEASTKYGLHLSILLKGARGSGKATLTRRVAEKSGIHLVELNCFDLLGDTDTQTEGYLRARFDTASDCSPSILLLRNIDALARKSQAMETGQEPHMSHVLRSCVEGLWEKSRDSGFPTVLVGTVSDADKCPNGVITAFKHEITIEVPNEAERLEVLTHAVDTLGIPLGPDVSLKDVATQTAALVAGDLADLILRAKMASVERTRRALPDYPLNDIFLSGIALTGSDFDAALSAARSNYSESIGAPKIPNVTWDDVGGLAAVKSDILDTIQLPLEHPELFADGLKKRSGILLYGPPGTGKTLLAKAVATSCSLNFFSVKGPELLNMYIGESEANVRRVFQRARDAKPCVIFFDELDSVAPKRGNQGDSGGVMDRIVSQLLAELDGMSGSKEGGDVFVIGATNRPDLLDPALLRPGRFDRMLYLSVSETHAAQLNILQALTRKFKLESDVGDLAVIADQCPFNLTGADFYALCSDAMLKAMTRKAGLVDEKIASINALHTSTSASPDWPHPIPMTPPYYLAQLASPDEVQVTVSRADFEGALKELVPSVSESEMEHYRRVQGQFSGQTIGADKTAAAAGKQVGESEQMIVPLRPRPSGSDVSSTEAYDLAPPPALSSSTGTNGLSNGSSATASDQGGSHSRDSSTVEPNANGGGSGSGKGKGKGKQRAQSPSGEPSSSPLVASPVPPPPASSEKTNGDSTNSSSNSSNKKNGHGIDSAPPLTSSTSPQPFPVQLEPSTSTSTSSSDVPTDAVNGKGDVKAKGSGKGKGKGKGKA